MQMQDLHYDSQSDGTQKSLGALTQRGPDKT